MMYSMALFLTAVALCLTLTGSADALILSAQGKTDYVIVTPKDAIPSEKRAAAELASFLQQIGGAQFAIQDDTTALPPKAVLLGNTSHLSKLGVTPDWTKLGKEGFLLQTKGEHLIIAGGRPRGTMYGVYAFLEEKLGCRWYTSKISNIPKRDTIALPDLNETQIPALEYREPFNTDGFDPDWASRNRCNSTAARLTEEHGGKIVYDPFVHSFYQGMMIPPSVYFKDHPEYFSEIDGKRTADNAQLCLTNPDVVKLMVQKVKEVIQKNPSVAIVSVSQNDWHGNCQCANCKAIDDAEGSPAGSLLTFVNQIAEQVEKEYPDVAIDTLAYQYTRKPPKTICPRPNVIVRLCSIECDFGQPLETGKRNQGFADDIRGWHKLCNRLYIWDYITSFSHYMVPFPNLHNLGANVRFFYENGVKGIFEEGNYGPGGCGENNELRNYMLAKMLWNPNVDGDAVRREFLNGVYGPAAKPIEEYQRMLEKSVADKDVNVPCWFTPDAAIFTDDLIAQSQALFDRAEAAVKGDKELVLRVRQARMPIDYVALCKSMGKSQGTWKLTETRFAPDVSKTVSDASNRFFETAKAVGLKCLSEGGHGMNPPQVDEFYGKVGLGLTGADVVWVKGDRLSAAVAPDMGCRLLAVRDTTPKLDRLNFSPNTAQSTGVAAWSETFYRNLGANSRFAADGQTGSYTADLPNSFKVTRSIAPAPDGIVVSSKVTNAKQDQPLQATARLLVALAGEVRLTGAFGEKTVPTLIPESLGNVAATAAEIAGKPVMLKAAAGGAVTIAVSGPLAAISTGPGPDGLVSVAVSFEVPTLKLNDSTEWKITVTCVNESGGVKKSAPGVIEAQDSSLSCYREGKLSGRRFEPTSSDGQVSYIIGSTNEWALQWLYPISLFEPNRKYDVLAVVRVLGKGDRVDGVGITYGVYNTVNKVGRGGGQLADAANKPGQWQTVRIATLVPEGGDYIWFAPAKNEAVKEIQLDRILMAPVSGD
ncbi:MAG: hypothetical protein AUJ92_07490 [Armatimonadetes bacterium CG2_30_59_28]|nr:MAG: hypothetical protein AUJ92_07490 [Armatimonadetes bacterium CG2_30_59_28]PIU67062.1 MAG: hypothetical protein COS85_02210 [Armatimonadetes bacterium CG07_land_8_20_14_0_80_59_28]PIY41391.1 MAG: hypothetical protein COZ05_15810 [Armatimonadetes bacterium CG_4_10_14_3_um_filter_59_10]